jgi:hypothetical protein
MPQFGNERLGEISGRCMISNEGSLPSIRQEIRARAWNVELVFGPMEKGELGACYAGTNDIRFGGQELRQNCWGSYKE